MRIFLAGIMQGSYSDVRLHSQNYRKYLRELLETNIPAVEVFDPYEKHPDSIHYTDEVGKSVFLKHNHLCREMDVILAFVPEASMGTAIEMWEGYQYNAVVVTITPLKTNWAIKFISHIIYDTLDDLECAVRSGEFIRLVTEAKNNLKGNAKNCCQAGSEDFS